MRSQPTLLARALRLLARREHSRVELARKLAPHASEPAQLDAVLDELERRRLLSAQRFCESLIHRRAPAFGARRIEQELGSHRIDDAVADRLLAQLRASEPQRALQVWRKRFGTAPRDAAERARQHRFLAQRGFDADTIRAVLKRCGAADCGDDE
ncbi:MAG TPA: recombination regulator RecX [Burkholderiaceae bacterium]|nr:recombination regulator RecX [Burkholderiaceae bacterium]